MDFFLLLPWSLQDIPDAIMNQWQREHAYRQNKEVLSKDSSSLLPLLLHEQGRWVNAAICEKPVFCYLPKCPCYPNMSMGMLMSQAGNAGNVRSRFPSRKCLITISSSEMFAQFHHRKCSHNFPVGNVLTISSSEMCSSLR